MKVLANNFVYLSNIESSILQNLRYASSDNFVGCKINGYNANKVIVKEKAALRLKDVQKYLINKGYTLVIYDAYRPRTAIQHFIKWSQNDDISTKKYYYPTLDKKTLFAKGYISLKSDHCKGYTFDHTIMPLQSSLKKISISERILKNGDKISFLDDGTLDMGTSFDCFHEASHHNSDLISEVAKNNRKILESTMQKFGFSTIASEWWHYTLSDVDDAEDYDFPIE